MFKISKRDNKTFIIKIKNQIIKVPYSFGSLQEIQQERACIEQVKGDFHFSAYLPDYKYIFSCSIVECLSPVSGDSPLIRKYFKDAFSKANLWEKKEIKHLIKTEVLTNFILEYLPKHHKLFKNLLNAIKMPASSSHGDFNINNILSGKNKLFFIDWSRYNNNSSRYFDLIDYYIFFKKEYISQSWIDVWKKEYKNKRDSILGIEVSEEYILSFGIWKASQELKILKMLNLLDRYKIKKYINFLNYLTNSKHI